MAKKARESGLTFSHVKEAARGHIYGEDVFALMLTIAEYHTALYEGKNTDALWNRVDELTRKMEKYYVPIGYDWPGAGILIYPADNRSQLDVVVANGKNLK